MNANQIEAKYQNKIGKINDRVSFMHSEPAAAAARELKAAEAGYISRQTYNFIWRVGQVIGDAGFFASVSHEADSVYMFTPGRI